VTRRKNVSFCPPRILLCPLSRPAASSRIVTHLRARQSSHVFSLGCTENKVAFFFTDGRLFRGRPSHFFIFHLTCLLSSFLFLSGRASERSSALFFLFSTIFVRTVPFSRSPPFLFPTVIADSSRGGASRTHGVCHFFYPLWVFSDFGPVAAWPLFLPRITA